MRANSGTKKRFASLPGTLAIVFAGSKVVVFVVGDSWYGWYFTKWEHKLRSKYWKDKIRRNRKRDRQNCQQLGTDAGRPFAFGSMTSRRKLPSASTSSRTQCGTAKGSIKLELVGFQDVRIK